MPSANIYPLLAQYNQWMNQKLYGLCAEIPDPVRRKNLGAFFESIHGTLNHILFGDRRWMERFTGKPFAGQLREDLYRNFDELWDQRKITDCEILDWSKTLTSAWLDQPLQWTSSMDGITRTQPKWLLVTHLFNHQTHHRGQLTTLLTQLRYDPGCTDLPWMPRWVEASERV
ncbi:DinB family protein [Lyngbya confervoides]|uniref:DinB family protein n=1 Tax=Lyngbya confervoides BDU141951 TaxID=1574623 RepID=A0ABD4T611_9CYAN|nr:DinB family protein [Lyngbya confervoides]MCM1983891.1 DinB family protein [Lyngbya confervoides BDU141951]